MNHKCASLADGGRSDKYGRDALLQPGKLRKGETRCNQFVASLQRISPESLHQPILDFGFGVGYFLLEGLRRGMDIYGVDLLPGKIARFRKLIDLLQLSSQWKQRCLVADGQALPFGPDRFGAISSWYVFEHIQHPGPVLRELVRITRKGGIICLRAEDARNGWEGHCKIPWVPFLPERLAQAWMQEFEVSPTLRHEVYDITQPQIIAILQELGCRIVIKAAEPRVLFENHRNLCTEDEVRSLARETRRRFEKGLWQPQPASLYLYAQKM